MSQKIPLIFKISAGFILIVLFFFSIIIVRGFLYPIALAILFSYLLYPTTSFLEKKGVPRIIANLIMILITLSLIALVFYFLYTQLSNLLENLPELKKKALNNLTDLEHFIEDKTGLNKGMEEGWLVSNTMDMIISGGTFLEKALSATGGTIVNMALIPVYIFFLLYYRNKIYNFLFQIIPQEHHTNTDLIVGRISQVTKKYMSGILMVVIILAILNSIGLYVIGIEHAMFLGVLAAIFSFIPYFGTWIGAIIPITMALLTEDSINTAFAVLLLFVVINFLENNILTPTIAGNNVALNPLATILTLIVGSMVWGIPGMFMAVPFIAMVKIIMENIKPFKPFAYLLGVEGTEEHSLTFDKIKRFYKRIFRK